MHAGKHGSNGTKRSVRGGTLVITKKGFHVNVEHFAGMSGGELLLLSVLVIIFIPGDLWCTGSCQRFPLVCPQGLLFVVYPSVKHTVVNLQKSCEKCVA